MVYHGSADLLLSLLGFEPQWLCWGLCLLMILVFFGDFCGTWIVKIGSFVGVFVLAISNGVLFILLILRCAVQEELVQRIFGESFYYLGILLIPNFLSVFISHLRVTHTRRVDSVGQKPKVTRFGFPNIPGFQFEFTTEELLDLWRLCFACIYVFIPFTGLAYTYLSLNAVFWYLNFSSQFWKLTSNQVSLDDLRQLVRSYQTKDVILDLHAVVTDGSGNPHNVSFNVLEHYPINKCRIVDLDEACDLPDCAFSVCRVDVKAVPFRDGRSDVDFHKQCERFRSENQSVHDHVSFRLIQKVAQDPNSFDPSRPFLVYRDHPYRFSKFVYCFLTFFTFCAHTVVNNFYHVVDLHKISITYEFSTFDDVEFVDVRSFPDDVTHSSSELKVDLDFRSSDGDTFAVPSVANTVYQPLISMGLGIDPNVSL